MQCNSHLPLIVIEVGEDLKEDLGSGMSRASKGGGQGKQAARSKRGEKRRLEVRGEVGEETRKVARSDAKEKKVGRKIEVERSKPEDRGVRRRVPRKLVGVKIGEKNSQSSLDQWVEIYRGEREIKEVLGAKGYVERIRKGKEDSVKVRSGVFNFSFRTTQQAVKEAEEKSSKKEE